jgi:hypothetical protein
MTKLIFYFGLLVAAFMAAKIIGTILARRTNNKHKKSISTL